jgi:hypothetical protein
MIHVQQLDAAPEQDYDVGFFFEYEIQLMDADSYQRSLDGAGQPRCLQKASDRYGAHARIRARTAALDRSTRRGQRLSPPHTGKKSQPCGWLRSQRVQAALT